MQSAVICSMELNMPSSLGLDVRHAEQLDQKDAVHCVQLDVIMAIKCIQKEKKMLFVIVVQVT